MKVNSKLYWDHRFDTDWVTNFGKQQSSFFATIALGAFPSWLFSSIQKEGLTICDWGCALGDGTNVIKQAFPQNAITGIDFSTVAIRTAGNEFSEINFYSEDLLKKSNTHKANYDVVFSSNTLEHFDNPWEVLYRISAFASQHLIILVPYREYERYSEHLYTFDEGNIPSSIGDRFSLTHAEIINGSDFAPSYWGDLQVLLVFSSDQVVHEKKLKLLSTTELRLIEALRKQDEFQKNLTEARNALIEEIRHTVWKLEPEIESFKKKLTEKDSIIGHQQGLLEVRVLLDERKILEQQLADTKQKAAADEADYFQEKKQFENTIFQMKQEVEDLRKNLEETRVGLNAALSKQQDILESRTIVAELETQLRAANSLKTSLEERLTASLIENEQLLANLTKQSEASAQMIESHAQKENLLKYQLEIAINEKEKLLLLNTSNKALQTTLEAEILNKDSLLEELNKEAKALQAAFEAEILKKDSLLEKLNKDAKALQTAFQAELKNKDQLFVELNEELNALQAQQAKDKVLSQQLQQTQLTVIKKDQEVAQLKKKLEQAKVEAGIKILIEEELGEQKVLLEAVKKEFQEQAEEKGTMHRSITDLSEYISRLERNIEWYKRTFEERSIWGILKDKTVKPGPRKEKT